MGLPSGPLCSCLLVSFQPKRTLAEKMVQARSGLMRSLTTRRLPSGRISTTLALSTAWLKSDSRISASASSRPSSSSDLKYLISVGLEMGSPLLGSRM